jgi:hypothetical protein
MYCKSQARKTEEERRKEIYKMFISLVKKVFKFYERYPELCQNLFFVFLHMVLCCDSAVFCI